MFNFIKKLFERKHVVTPLKFERYTSIENSYRQKEVDSIVVSGQSGGKFVVTEKIHGSNASIWYNGKDFRYAKRSCFIADNDNFNNCQNIFKGLKPKIIELYNYLKAKDSNVNTIGVYGELFGGHYNHPEVDKVKNAIRVNAGVQYSPDNNFIVFDIKVNGVYQDYIDTRVLCLSFNIPVVAPLFYGTFKEALEYPNEFQTTIPKLFNLPDIENNTCEGVVIKPIDERRLPNGNRVILKNKNAKFTEREVSKNPKTARIFEPQAQAYHDNLMTYICENRLRNVLSKVGEVTHKDFGKILGEFNKDILEDFNKDNTIELKSKDDLKAINKLMNSKAATLIKANFMNIIDGNY